MPAVLSILSKETDVIGTDKYRANDAAIPMAYRASAEITAKPNADGSNVQMTVMTAKPLPVTNNGVTTLAGTFRMTTKFNSLQTVTSDSERTAIIDAHIELLTNLKTSLANGILPSQALTLTKTL